MIPREFSPFYFHFCYKPLDLLCLQPSCTRISLSLHHQNHHILSELWISIVTLIMNKMGLVLVITSTRTAIMSTNTVIVPIIMTSTIHIAKLSISIVRATPALVPADVTHTMVIITSMVARANG